MPMPQDNIHAVTGAFGYSGQYIARRLLDEGRQVMTLTDSTNRDNPFRGQVEARPFHFDAPGKLIESLRGVSVLYNTYWVRFCHGDFSFEQAVRNTRTLFQAAREAGVERVVHVSITNPSEESSLGYFRGKAQLERTLMESGLSHAILRPAVLFGKEDILVNNIAWAIRRFPVMGVFGKGDYKLQPIHVDDLAALAVAQGKERDNRIIDAIGPETFTYRELVKTVAAIIGRKRRVVSVPPVIGFLMGWLVGKWVGDVMITRDEIKGLMGGLLAVDSPPAGATRLTEWAKAHADTLGRRYASELARRKDRRRAYAAN